MIFQNSVNLQADCKNCLPHSYCVMQSEETPVSLTEAVTLATTAETTDFMDVAPGVVTGHVAQENDFDTADAVTSAGLTDFLSRPVRIAAFTWSQSDPVGLLQTISPWNLYFNNANIKYKLNNFAFLRADLHVKVVINASPFYYGSMRACYQPLPSFKSSTIISGTSGGVANSELIPYSQQPGLWLKPQMSEGGEMVLPFLYPRSFLKAQVAQDFTDMGTLRFLVYNTLSSANGVTGSGVSVQVYAWAENVTLAGPSVGLAMQADEYGVGPVSSVASTVASIAGKLRMVPVLGKFATATEMGATAIAGIAKLFGFTNVPVIEPAMPFRPSPFPQIASPEIGYPVEKLTLDSKNELSIDPSLAGLASEDPLAISNFVTKQSYLASSTWSTSTVVDTPLFTAAVSPMMGTFPAATGAFEQYTPMALVSRLFQSWRGDIIFTFRFIATPFHKGRVRISYDPYGSAVQTTADTGPTVFNKIVDLGAETDVEVRIPYQQALAWCYTYDSGIGNKWTTSASPTVPYTDTFDNGILSVKVLTLLTAPVSTSSVFMQVFVRGAENLEYGNPKTVTKNSSPFVMQSEEYSETVTAEATNMGSNSSAPLATRSRVHFGENVGSLRVLLRRSNLVDVFVPASNTTNFGVWYLKQTKYPPFYGYDPNGYISANGITVPGSTFPANLTFTTPWHLITNCFLGQRGSMHWHYNWDGPQDVTMRATRSTVDLSLNTFGYAGGTVSSTGVGQLITYNNVISSTAGAAITNQKTQSALSIGNPNYTVFKFQSTDPLNATRPVTSGGRYDGSIYEGLRLELNSYGSVTNLTTGRLERYCAIGTDYTPLFFLNCPSLYSYTITSAV